MLWQLKTHVVQPGNRAQVKAFGISLPVLYNHWTIENRYASVTGKTGNVEINNSPQAGIEPGASRCKIQHSTEWAKEISH